GLAQVVVAGQRHAQRRLPAGQEASVEAVHPRQPVGAAGAAQGHLLRQRVELRQVEAGGGRRRHGLRRGDDGLHGGRRGGGLRHGGLGVRQRQQDGDGQQGQRRQD